MIRSHCLRRTVAAAIVMTAAACSSGGDDAADPTATGADPAATGPAEERASTTVETGSSTTSAITAASEERSTTSITTASSTTTITTTTIAFPSAADELGLASIEQLTPLVGGGTRPILGWAPVDGAVRYHVIVLSPAGSVYWGWETGDTSVPVGGTPRLDEGAPGPAVSDGMTWSVSAVDDAGHVVALSAHRPISP